MIAVPLRLAFARKHDNARTPVAVHGEDLATVLLRFDNGTRGSLRVGQVSPGDKNDLQLELNGRSGSLRWEQEGQNKLWPGSHEGPNALLMKDSTLLSNEAAADVRLPGGHQEGWADAFFNVIDDVYKMIRSNGVGVRPATVCDFAQATRTACILDAMLQSANKGGVWASVASIQDPSAEN